MKEQILYNFYRKNEISEDETAKALKALENCQNFLKPEIDGIENSNEADIRRYLEYLAEQKHPDTSAVIALSRAAWLGGNRQLYIFLVQITERGRIIKNMKEHIDKVLGKERSREIFSELPCPEVFEPPEKALSFTNSLVEAVESGRALQANAHGIPVEAFAKEAELFRTSKDLDSYLKDAHKRSVHVLQEHADSGEIWFEQIITQPVVDFVSNNPEILGGVLEGSRIYWTKIPFDPDAWLKESDPEKRRYLACHCPMARESLNTDIDGEKISGKWCNCTAGFVKQRFNAVFGAETEVELLESVLDGAESCRFAVHVPKDRYYFLK
ncbi:MAG TPA: hypothetical protein DCO79_09655 [Spirochaeta sp.]|nr:hypothetical protein [Spirochaeta sp.]